MSKVTLPILAILLLVWSAPALAGDFSIFGSYLDTEDLEDTVGGGIKAGIDLGASPFQLDLRATYLPDLTEDFGDFVRDPGNDPPGANDISAIPVDAGLLYDFNRGGTVNPYVGGGASYYFLDSDHGELSDEAGYYLVGGLELGRRNGGVGFFAEALYRNVQATVRHDPTEFDQIDDINFDQLRERDLDIGGLGLNAGLIWRF